MTTLAPDGSAQAKLDMLSGAEGVRIHTANTRVVGGNMVSTTYNHTTTNHIYTASTPNDGPASSAEQSQMIVTHSLSPSKQSIEVQTLLHWLLQPFLLFSGKSSSKRDDDFSATPFDGQYASSSIRTLGEVYVHSMLDSGRGLACWKPRPRKPINNGQGVMLGDVGTYTVEGGFRKIFNLWHDEASIQSAPCASSFDPPYRAPSRQTPEPFVNAHELEEGLAVVRGAWYKTAWVDRDTIDSFEFHHLEGHQRGAVLAMTSPGRLEELDEEDKAMLHQHICQYAGLIYSYANGRRPIGHNEALYMITGCIQSESWALAAFKDAVPDPNHTPMVLLQHGVGKNSSSMPTYVWRSPGTFDAHVGRSEIAGAKDQALFLRGFKLEFSQSFRSRYPRGPHTGSYGPGHSDPRTFGTPDADKDGSGGGRETQSRPPGGNGGGAGNVAGAGGGSYEALDNHIHISTFPDESGRKPYHPCDVINRFLLEKTGLDFALSHDDDWRFILGQRPSASTDRPEAVPDSRTIQVTKGVASLIQMSEHGRTSLQVEPDGISIHSVDSECGDNALPEEKDQESQTVKTNSLASPILPSDKGRKAKEVLCQCGKAECTVSEIQLHADTLEIPWASAAFILNMLKKPGNLAVEVAPGLNQAAADLLIIINNLQDMAEVDGGFRRIVVECCELMAVVKRRLEKNERLSPTVRQVIRELCEQVEEIRQYSTKMLKRGRFRKFFLGQVDKAKVGDWRTRLNVGRTQLTAAWDTVKTELLLDIAAGSSGDWTLHDEIAGEIGKTIQEYYLQDEHGQDGHGFQNDGNCRPIGDDWDCRSWYDRGGGRSEKYPTVTSPPMTPETGVTLPSLRLDSHATSEYQLEHHSLSTTETTSSGRDGTTFNSRRTSESPATPSPFVPF